MAKFYHPLLALIASATESELAKYVEYLKRENADQIEFPADGCVCVPDGPN